MHSNVVIICDGVFPKSEYPRYLIRTADFIICCDGALVKFLRNSKAIFGEQRLPDLVTGDMDTLSESMQRKYADIIVKEDEQEHNDQTKAVRWALNNLKGVESIHIIGATGGRADHTIGNASLLMEYTRMFNLEGINIESISDEGTIFPINDSTEIECGYGREVSIFTPDSSLRIKSEGLMYPTDDVVFDNWWKATLNKSIADTVKLKLSHPAPVLIILD